MHHNNPHANGYDMQALAQVLPELAGYLQLSKHNRQTIDFSNSVAVKLLNKALLMHHYGLEYWDIPDGYLCPPIPGRVDYLCHLDEYLKQNHYFQQDLDSSKGISALDIGTGANLIYPILANQLLNWKMLASDIDDGALNSAQTIINNNKHIRLDIQLRKQTASNKIFSGIIQPDDYFHVSMCNPPFHESQEAAMSGSVRKNKNLNRNKNKRHSNINAIATNKQLNFAGQSNELWCKGGEKQFIKNMIFESQDYANQVGCFTCLVSKKENLSSLKQSLKKVSAEFDVVEMAQGNKISRFIAWRFK